MAEAPILLSDLLADTRAAVDGVVAAGVETKPEALAVGKALGTLGDAVDGAVRDACDRDLVGLLVEGWSKASELRRYGDKAKYPPPSSTRMVLGKHSMTIAIDPQLTIVIGRAVRVPLKFIVAFAATVSAVRLAIVDGAIDAVDLGALTLSAKVRWGKAELPLPLKTREIPLPGHFEIKPPFAIPR